MYGPTILLLCARPADDIVGAGAAILRARAEGASINTLMLSNGLVQPPRWRLLARARLAERAEAVIQVTRQLAVDFGHQFNAWHGQRLAGRITADLAAVAKDVEHIFLNLRPDVVWAPAFLGLDPDYDALNLIASRLPRVAQVNKISKDFTVYEYLPRPLQRQQLDKKAGHKSSGMVFPTRQGMELPLNLTATESAKQVNALKALRLVYDEPLTPSERALFRLLPAHHYAQPPYGYKNPLMIRGQPANAATASVTTRLLLQQENAPFLHLPRQ